MWTGQMDSGAARWMNERKRGLSALAQLSQSAGAQAPPDPALWAPGHSSPLFPKALQLASYLNRPASAPTPLLPPGPRWARSRGV